MRLLLLLFIILSLTGMQISFVQPPFVEEDTRTWVAMDMNTDWTEQDPNNDIARSSTATTVTTIRRDVDAYYGIAKSLPGDFKCRFKINVSYANNGCFCHFILFSNGLGSAIDATKAILGIRFERNYTPTNDFELLFYDTDSGNDNGVEWEPSLNTDYYIELELDGNTCYRRIYSDSGFSTLVTSDSVSVANPGFTHVQTVASRDASPTSSPAVSFVISNLEFYE